MNVKGDKKEDQVFRKKLWDAKNKNFIWQFKKMKFSQQHTGVRAERQIEKSLKEFCTSKLPLKLLGRREILEPAAHCSFLHLYYY